MFEDKATDIKRLVLNYVKSLQGMLQEAAGNPGTAPMASKTKIVLDNGFPKLPRPFDVDKYNKKELENLYRDYIGSHYCTWVHLDATHIFDICLGVATKRRTRQAPWSRMKPDTLKYVDADKLPRPDFVLDDPRAMKMELLHEFFAHIAEREKTFQLGEVFHFKYADSRRKGGRDGSEDEAGGILNEDSGAGPSDCDAGPTDCDAGPTEGDAGPTPGDSGADHGEASRDAEHARTSGGAGSAPTNSGDIPNGNQQQVNYHSNSEMVPPELPIPNAITMKKANKTPGPTKQAKSRKNPGVPDGTQSKEPRPAPPRKKTKGKMTTIQATSAHGINSAGVAEPPPPPRPKPRPVTRPVNRSNHQSTARNEEGTSTQSPGTDNDPHPLTQPQQRVPHAAIDPSLLAASHQPSRALVNTADNLALQEASRFAVKGNRVPKKKQQV